MSLSLQCRAETSLSTGEIPARVKTKLSTIGILMKTITKQLFILALLASGFTAQAITNSAIAVSGTNIVLSWPSYGYESYLIQYRQTLDPSDSWSALTNAYHANSSKVAVVAATASAVVRLQVQVLPAVP
jgi:hypothetical protein